MHISITKALGSITLLLISVGIAFAFSQVNEAFGFFVGFIMLSYMI